MKVKKLSVVGWSWLLFLVSVPGVLLFFWLVTALFERPGEESLIVQAFAIFFTGLSSLGTITGFLLALYNVVRTEVFMKEGVLGGRVAMIVNGLCAAIWISIFALALMSM